MVIHGREIKFAFTVGAAADLSAIAPGGDLDRLPEALGSSNFADRMEASALLIAALNKGYEERRAFDEPGYKAQPLTEAELRTLELTQLTELVHAAFESINHDKKTTVEVEPERGKKTGARR